MGQEGLTGGWCKFIAMKVAWELDWLPQKQHAECLIQTTGPTLKGAGLHAGGTVQSKHQKDKRN